MKTIPTTKEELILDFINQFSAFGPEVVNCFSNGMCYQFSDILRLRFRDENIATVYDSIVGHFATRINGRIYDITGDITDDPQYSWIDWRYIYENDQKLAERLRRDCHWKVPNGLILCGLCSHCYRDDWGTNICDKDNHPVTSNDFCGKGVPK